MYEDPEESPSEDASDPKVRAKEKADEFRMHAELAAVYEGPRKFDAEVNPDLDASLAREIQKAVAKLEKGRAPETPIIPPASADEATAVLTMPQAKSLSTGDYHVHRRPGEVMMVRWLEGEQVDTFYQRLQAHFDAAMDGYKEDEQQANAWKQDPATLAFLDALEKVEVKMADRYLRDTIKQHGLFILSTQTADEININYLTETLMGVSPEQLVGEAAAPGDAPTDQELAWFFKLFALRGMVENVERMCFFTYLQKTDDDAW